MSSPSKALSPLSSERMNKQPISGSPLASEFRSSVQRKGRGISDVQSKVAFLNNLSQTASPVRRDSQAQAQASPAPEPSPQPQPRQSAGGSAALQRAILGREEAESALANVSAELSEAQSRERRISERLESLLEELQTAKERQAHERSVFEKEIRKARKEAFRAGSTLVKTQEELKNARTEAKVWKDELQVERESKEQAKQEAFERAYALAGLTEELEVLKERLRSAETNQRSDNLEAQAQEMRRKDLGRMSIAEGDLAMFATPPPRRPKRSAEEYLFPVVETRDEGTQMTPPKKQRLSDVSAEATPQPTNQVQDVTAVKDDAESALAPKPVSTVEQDLMMERRARHHAEALVEFMQLECRFRTCTCRQEEEKEIKEAKREARRLEAEAQRNRSQQVKPKQTAKPTAKKEHLEPMQRPKATQPERVHIHESANAPQNLQPAHSHHLIDGLEEYSDYHERPPTRVKSRSPYPMDDLAEEHDAVESDVEVKSESESEVENVDEEPLITFSPETGTFHTIPSPARSPQKSPQRTNPHDQRQSTPQGLPTSPLAKYQTTVTEPPKPLIPNKAPPPARRSPVIADVPFDPVPRQGSAQGHVEPLTNMKRIPLRPEAPPSSDSRHSAEPPIDRETALAQIRARRGRANSMKRSASANEGSFRSGGMGVTPVRSARRIPGINGTNPRSEEMRSRRDMSAPVRMIRR